MNKYTPSARSKSQRQLKMGEELRHLLANIFLRGELRDPDLFGLILTVTEVSVSPDLANASVFFVPVQGKRMEGDGLEKIQAALTRAAPWLRSEIARSLTTRRAPTLNFHYDQAFDKADNITRLLNLPQVRHDLGNHQD